MKKVIPSMIVVLFAVVSIAQAQVEKTESNFNSDTQRNQIAVKYRLFATQNIWTFIKLNTRNGQMWQVQYDIEGNNRFETSLYIKPLVNIEKELNDRFTLYPTQNMWTFILLDQYDGRTWQVQWSREPKNRGIIPIE